MPRLTIRQHGASASIPRHPIAGNLQKPEERKANRGWTAAVARRNSQYLQRIDFERVDGTPYAVTLTLPAWQMEQVTPVVMHRLIDVMIKYLRRHGMLHFHWIIEFTARRMPHIHMSVWMADRYEEWDRHLRQYIVWDNNESAVVSNVVVKWLELTEAEGLHTSSNSQDVQLIDGNEAWLVYIAKHGIRGVKHYQRALDNMPDEWRDGAGAMWGHDRKMPVADDSVLPMDMRAFHQFRREARKWCCAHACMIKDPHRRAKAIGQARRSNRCCRPELSVVRPVSVWIPKDVTISIVRGLRSRGYMIGWDAYQWGVDELARLRDEGGSEERRRILGKSLMEMLRT